MATLKMKCKECGGRGLSDMVKELDGVALICTRCAGSGARTIKYQPFKARVKVTGVKSVAWDAGQFIQGGRGAYGRPVTYAAWLKGAQPTMKRGND